MSINRQTNHLRPGSLAFTRASAKAPTADDVRSGRATLQLGHQGEAVRRVHLLLGMDGPLAYTAATVSAVMRFQQRHQLSANGLVDRATLVALEKYAPASATELTPLAQLVKDILTDRGGNTRDKIAQIWKAFTEGVTSEYGNAIDKLKHLSIDRASTDSWVKLLLSYAAMAAPDKAVPPFINLAKAVILNDSSNCQIAYLHLPAEAQRSLLDEAEYERALFKVAEEQGTTDANFLFMKQLFRIRFPHITTIEPSESSAPKWEVSALRRVYELMRDLPAHHLTQIKSLYRAPSKQSSLSEDSFVAGEFDPDGGKLNVRQSPGRDMLLDSGLSKVNAFDFTIRHEIGHAVDNLLMACHKRSLQDGNPLKFYPLKYYSQLPGVSGPDWQWVYYENRIFANPPPYPGAGGFFQLVQEMMANSRAPHNRPPDGLSLEEFVDLLYWKHNKQEIMQSTDEKGVKKQHKYIKDYRVALKKAAKNPDIESKRDLKKRLANHNVYRALTDESALKQPFTQGSCPSKTTFGDRVFVKTYDATFASFSLAAFARRIRKYCARGPAEWFAETYSLYYDPEGRRVLEATHPMAARYLENLLRTLAPR